MRYLEAHENKLAVWLLQLCFIGVFLVGCLPVTPPTNLCPQFIAGQVRSPALVQVLVKVQTCDPKPKAVTGLEISNFTLKENNDVLSVSESKVGFDPARQNFGTSNLLLLDLSGSVRDDPNGLSTIRAAVEKYVSQIFDSSGSSFAKLGVFWFDGEDKIKTLVDFNTSKDAILLKLKDAIPDSKDSSTNLYGATVQGIEKLVSESINTPLNSNSLLSNITIFTDGKDRAGRITKTQVLSEINSKLKGNFLIQTVGLGTEIDQNALIEIGRDGSIFAKDFAELSTKLGEAATAFLQQGNSFYSIRYCSPLRAGKGELSISVQKDKLGQATLPKLNYSASKFAGGCDPQITTGTILEELSSLIIPINTVKISVTPKTQTLQAGATAIPLNAVLENSTETINWTLEPATGSGSLSATTGTSVNYTPPSSVSAILNVSVKATAAGVSDTASITVNPKPIPAIKFAANRFHTCGLSTTGGTYCWGGNLEGELGDNSTTARLTPTFVNSNLSFISITAGLNHTCGLTSTGKAYCWGRNVSGELGDSSTTSRLIPTSVSSNLSFTSITAGYNHTCGLTSTGKAYCWGGNGGQLGDNSTTNSSVPVAVANNLTFSSITAGRDHTCGLTSTGKAYCWGINTYGQLGDNSVTTKLAPIAVNSNLTFSSITTNYDHTCGLTTTNIAYCWGSNLEGQLGDNSNTSRLIPTAVSSNQSFTSITTGIASTCGLTSIGTAYCWGRNREGGLGDNSTTPSLVPIAVSGSLIFSSITIGGYHTCGVTSTGIAYCWGYNHVGQIGNNSTTSTSAPVAVSGGLTFASKSVLLEK